MLRAASVAPGITFGSLRVCRGMMMPEREARRAAFSLHPLTGYDKIKCESGIFSKRSACKRVGLTHSLFLGPSNHDLKERSGLHTPRKAGKGTIGIIEKLAENVTQDLNLELVDVKFRSFGKQPHLTVFIDKPGGVSLDDCEKVSRSLGVLLDGEDPIPHRYFLEVSSPGPERPLKKEADFRRFLGHDIQIRTAEKIDGRRNFKGVLKKIKDNFITIETGKSEQFKIDFKEVAKANLYEKKQGVKK